jgi:hypothetical protein
MWSSAFIAGIFGLRSPPPLLLMLMRFAAAGVLLAVVAWVTRAPWPRGRQLGHVIVAGLLLQAAQFGGFYWAMALGLPAALTALIQALTPCSPRSAWRAPARACSTSSGSAGAWTCARAPRPSSWSACRSWAC